MNHSQMGGLSLFAHIRRFVRQDIDMKKKWMPVMPGLKVILTTNMFDEGMVYYYDVDIQFPIDRFFPNMGNYGWKLGTPIIWWS